MGWEACLYNASFMASFVRDHLGPVLHAEQPGVKIIGFDHNKDHVHIWADAAYSDPKAREYFDGMGVPQDHQMALKWYKRPAERGHADAQIALGGTYAAIEDYIAAYMWNEIAAKNKQKNSGQMRNLIESKMTPDQIAEAQKLARECVRKKYRGC